MRVGCTSLRQFSMSHQSSGHVSVLCRCRRLLSPSSRETASSRVGHSVNQTQLLKLLIHHTQTWWQSSTREVCDLLYHDNSPSKVSKMQLQIILVFCTLTSVYSGSKDGNTFLEHSLNNSCVKGWLIFALCQTHIGSCFHLSLWRVR